MNPSFVFRALLAAAVAALAAGISGWSPTGSRKYGSLIVPKVVREAAEKAFAVPHTPLKGGESRVMFIGIFAYEFKDGFLSPDGIFASGPDVCRMGNEAGKAYCRAHPAALDALLRGYGYRLVEQSGDYTGGFEQSGFTPENSRQQWWLEGINHVVWPELTVVQSLKFSDSDLFKLHKGRLRVTGYLSPPGCYGQEGHYSRELLAVKIEKTPAVTP